MASVAPVCVTGAGGFIASHIATRNASDGHHLARSWVRMCGGFGPHGSLGVLVWVDTAYINVRVNWPWHVGVCQHTISVC